jgi:hypothetical protein
VELVNECPVDAPTLEVLQADMAAPHIWVPGRAQGVAKRSEPLQSEKRRSGDDGAGHVFGYPSLITFAVACACVLSLFSG